MPMDFDWDEGKRRKNLAKHGLDFADAARMGWATATILEDIREDYGERRYLAFAMWDGRLHMVAFAIRSENFRIISFRKASKKEAIRHGKA
jgi:uncharacterized DUF497 family protein